MVDRRCALVQMGSRRGQRSRPFTHPPASRTRAPGGGWPCKHTSWGLAWPCLHPTPTPPPPLPFPHTHNLHEEGWDSVIIHRHCGPACGLPQCWVLQEHLGRQHAQQALAAPAGGVGVRGRWEGRGEGRQEHLGRQHAQQALAARAEGRGLRGRCEGRGERKSWLQGHSNRQHTQQRWLRVQKCVGVGADGLRRDGQGGS